MRAFRLISVLAALSFSTVATAQPIDPPALAEQSTDALARRYIEIGGAEDLFVEGAAYGFRQAAEAGGVRFTENQWQRVQTAVRAAFRPAADVFINEFVTFTATSSREDLSEALSYYETPAGQRYVAATIAYSFPLSAYLATQGRVPLQDAPPASALETQRLAQAQLVAALLVSKMHTSERATVEMTSFGINGLESYIARSLASDLQLPELDAAYAWINSPASMRLEGPSAERTLLMQTASMRAMAVVDMPALVQTLQQIMREPPPT